MKNAIIQTFCFICIFITSCTSQNDKDNDFRRFILDSHNIGIYLPQNFVNCLNETKNYSIAQYTSSLYDYLIVNKNNILYHYSHLDKYTKISKKKLRNYQFNLNSTHEPIIIDDCGNTYIKIADNTNNEIEVINRYIAEIILDELIKFGIIYIENYMIRIPSVNIDKWNIPRFKIDTFRSGYTLNANLRLYDCDDDEIVYFEITDDNRYYIYKYNESQKEIKWVIW
jgi:hypothetical protein